MLAVLRIRHLYIQMPCLILSCMSCISYKLYIDPRFRCVFPGEHSDNRSLLSRYSERNEQEPARILPECSEEAGVCTLSSITFTIIFTYACRDRHTHSLFLSTHMVRILPRRRSFAGRSSLAFCFWRHCHSMRMGIKWYRSNSGQ